MGTCKVNFRLIMSKVNIESRCYWVGSVAMIMICTVYLSNSDTIWMLIYVIHHFIWIVEYFLYILQCLIKFKPVPNIKVNMNTYYLHHCTHFGMQCLTISGIPNLCLLLTSQTKTGIRYQFIIYPVCRWMPLTYVHANNS